MSKIFNSLMFKKKGVLSRIYAWLLSYASVHSVRLAKIILFGGKILSAISIGTYSIHSKLILCLLDRVPSW